MTVTCAAHHHLTCRCSFALIKCYKVNTLNLTPQTGNVSQLYVICPKAHRWLSATTYLTFVYIVVVFFNIYLFIWLRRVLVAARGIFFAACRIFSYSM